MEQTTSCSQNVSLPGTCFRRDTTGHQAQTLGLRLPNCIASDMLFTDDGLSTTLPGLRVLLCPEHQEHMRLRTSQGTCNVQATSMTRRFVSTWMYMSMVRASP